MAVGSGTVSGETLEEEEEDVDVLDDKYKSVPVLAWFEGSVLVKCILWRARSTVSTPDRTGFAAIFLSVVVVEALVVDDTDTDEFAVVVAAVTRVLRKSFQLSNTELTLQSSPTCSTCCTLGYD
jgi:hypothetical protein